MTIIRFYEYAEYALGFGEGESIRLGGASDLCLTSDESQHLCLGEHVLI